MARRFLPVLGGLLAAGLIAAGCGSSDDKSSAAHSTTHGSASASAVSSKPTETGAATLRAGLTALLQEHVYLAGIAVDAGVGGGLDSKAFTSAAGELDKNSVALSEAIGSVYGDAVGKQFLALWRKHITFFVDYTKARAAKDETGRRKAKADLDSYRSEFGAFIASANPNLTKKAVADELIPHVSSLFAAIDAVVAKSPTVFEKLRMAAEHMPMTADVLAGAIAKQYPDKFPGAVDGGASTLRSNLTALLQEHVYLAGLAVKTGVGSGLDSKAFTASAGALDRNSVALSEAIGSVYGKAAGDQFLALWRKHIGFFVDYTKARAGGDAKGQRSAQAKLDGYRAQFGAFIASANPNLTKEAVADELTPHVNSVLAAIDEVTAKSPETYAKLRAAAAHMPMTANVLAGAIAKQFPKKFAACHPGDSCGASASHEETTAAPAPKVAKNAVQVKTFIFGPAELAVARGTTVTWTNSDSADHTVTSGTRANPDAAGKPDGRFAGKLPASGGTYSHKFPKAGVYRYFCALHTGTGMTGEVVVH